MLRVHKYGSYFLDFVVLQTTWFWKTCQVHIICASMFCFGLYNNKTLYVLICAHFITLNLRHIVVKHLQQSASTSLHWVRDNIYLQSVILRNMSYFVLLTLVFHCKQLREQRILSSKSWMWATWVILPVNITLNHQVLSWQRWLIHCWILLVSLFLTRMLQNGHLLGEQ